MPRIIFFSVNINYYNKREIYFPPNAVAAAMNLPNAVCPTLNAVSAAVGNILINVPRSCAPATATAAPLAIWLY